MNNAQTRANASPTQFLTTQSNPEHRLLLPIRFVGPPDLRHTQQTGLWVVSAESFSDQTLHWF